MWETRGCAQYFYAYNVQSQVFSPPNAVQEVFVIWNAVYIQNSLTDVIQLTCGVG